MGFWQVTVDLWGGFQNALLLFTLTLLFSLPLGLLLSFGSMSRFAPLRYLVKTFVWVIRGTPLMLQLLIVFFVPRLALLALPDSDSLAIGAIRFVLSLLVTQGPLARFYAAVIAFVINYACYFSEIYRGGIESISRSQYEAGQVLGMTRSQVFFRVILLQVVKRIMAPMANEIITLVKDTALARVIAVSEILFRAENLMASALIWPLFYAGVFYLLFIGILTLLFGFIEKKLSYFRS
jgi:polar amino acid transport system permease protein